MTKRILIVEDDPFHCEVIESHIRGRWPNTTFDFEVVTNEKDFAKRFNELANAELALAIIDMIIIDQMIPYVSKDDPDWKNQKTRESGFRGGTRCYDQLHGDTRTTQVPVVFYTILDREAVPPGADYVKKTGNTNLDDLLDKVAKATGLP